MADNPHAFPTHPDGQGHPLFTGMTLRDWFAGQALAGIMASGCTYAGKTDNRDAVAADAYAHADAMLAERARKEASNG